MKVFISWSGEPSHKVAEQLYAYLQRFLNTVEPWLSSQDIAKGTLWRNEIAQVLEFESVGLLVLNKNNFAAPWVNFEAGSLAKNPKTSRVIPYLINMRPSELTGPFVDLNAASFVPGSDNNVLEFERVLQSINDANKDGRVPDNVWKPNFHLIWPELEAKLAELASIASDEKAVHPESSTEINDVLDNLADEIRNQGNLVRLLLDSRGVFLDESQVLVMNELLSSLKNIANDRIFSLMRTTPTYRFTHIYDLNEPDFRPATEREAEEILDFFASRGEEIEPSIKPFIEVKAIAGGTKFRFNTNMIVPIKIPEDDEG